MNDKSLITHQVSEEEKLIQMVCATLASAESRRAYRSALKLFFDWCREHKPGQQINRSVVLEYRGSLVERGLSSSSVNLHLSAIRRMACEYQENLESDDPAILLMAKLRTDAIQRIKGIPKRGIRVGYWMTAKQMRQLLDAPDVTTAKGLRDRACLALLVGSGIRCSECTNLKYENLQQRPNTKGEQVWMLVNVQGKGGKVRSIPIPSWTAKCVFDWTEFRGITSGPLFGGMYKSGKQRTKVMHRNALARIVRTYAEQCGINEGNLGVHDVRRSYARRLYDRGCPLPQIQLVLGHESLETTLTYINTQLSLDDPVSDYLDLFGENDALM